MSKEPSTAVPCRDLVEEDGMNKGSGVSFVYERGNLGETSALIVVAEAVPENDGKGGLRFWRRLEEWILARETIDKSEN